MEDESIFEKVLRVETKDIFVDLKKNRNGVYLKISERNGSTRNTILIPASGLERLQKVLEDAIQQAKDKGISRVRKQRVIGDPEVKSRSVYVSGLAWETNDDQLSEHMSEAGPVVKSVILRVKNKRSLGCGVVEYETREAAIHAVNILNDTDLGGRKIHCREDRDSATEGAEEMDEEAAREPLAKATDGLKSKNSKRRERKPRTGGVNGEFNPSVPGAEKVLNEFKVFVTNLSWDTTDEGLTTYMSSAGEVSDVSISLRNGRSLGYGYVEFADPASALLAIEHFHNKELDGRVITVRQYFEN